MRINIITLSCAMNYGAVLQTYALGQYLIENGHDVKIIDYITERYNFDDENYVDDFTRTSRVWGMNRLTKWVWRKTYFAKMKKNRDVFRKFVKSYVPLTKTYYTNEELCQDKPLADLYITGSDQVWNSDYNWSGEIDEPYYLGFLDKEDKRISYASSFGKNKLCSDEKNKVKDLLKQYSRLSVREDSAVSILADIGIISERVCDPTILCNVDSYNKITECRENTWSANNYILLFMIGFDKKLYSYSKTLARENGMKLIVLLPAKQDTYKCRGNKIVTPEVEDWLLYIKKAEFIITNSFHGTVFSILFNVRFLSSVMVENAGRIQNLLEITELEQQKLDTYDYDKFISIYNNSIDYAMVNRNIEKIRSESQKWLNDAIATTRGGCAYLKNK